MRSGQGTCNKQALQSPNYKIVDEYIKTYHDIGSDIIIESLTQKFKLINRERLYEYIEYLEPVVKRCGTILQCPIMMSSVPLSP